jgi:hypothetical protein
MEVVQPLHVVSPAPTTNQVRHIKEKPILTEQRIELDITGKNYTIQVKNGTILIIIL